LAVNPDSKAGISIFRYLFTRWGHFDPPDHPFPAYKLCSLDERTLMKSADFLRGRRFWDLAAGLYRNAITKDEQNAAAYAGLGAALLQGQEYAEAARASREAQRRDPRNRLAQMTLDRLAVVTTTAPSTGPAN
jgi:cytochrome c-type biogenesis protein CcmH/NrfG